MSAVSDAYLVFIPISSDIRLQPDVDEQEELKATLTPGSL